jgi:diketogulonate reductase-like aldo/keto reductase
MTLPLRTLIYGTAWKEAATARLVGLALASGFRAIDTANQRKHYVEAAVGEAVTGAIQSGLLERGDLWLQTKFTHRDGQDNRLPYDPRAAVAEQVRQSFDVSLEHLGTARIDSYVLHGPSVRRGLAPADLEAWGAMEDLHLQGRAAALGVSNVTREQLELLLERARIRPAAVQNRCYASRGWDCEVRSICLAQGIVYQGFSLLTANRAVLQSPAFRAIAARRGLTPSQLVFRFALDAGMTPLTGTTNPEHMRDDLAAAGAAPLDAADVRAIESIR